MKAKQLLKKLDYLPRWSWYLLSVFIAGPVGPFAVYLLFHVLQKVAQEQEEEETQNEHAHRANAYGSAAAYEDEDCVVSSDEDINRRWARTQSSAAQARQYEQPAYEQAKTHTGNSFEETDDVSAVIRSGHDAMRRIRHANDLIPDPELSAQIDSIENSCAQILSILEQRPQLLPQLRTFLRYYLPTTLKLLDARARLENTANTRKAREVRTQISQAVGVIDKAFLKQVEALDAYRFIDLESEMDVLRDMLKSDGLIDEDKPEDDPFAQVLGGH